MTLIPEVIWVGVRSLRIGLSLLIRRRNFEGDSSHEESSCLSGGGARHIAFVRYVHVRPGGTESLHQQLEHGAGVLAGVDVAGAEVGREQFVTAEHV